MKFIYRGLRGMLVFCLVFGHGFIWDCIRMAKEYYEKVAAQEINKKAQV